MAFFKLFCLTLSCVVVFFFSEKMSLTQKPTPLSSMWFNSTRTLDRTSCQLRRTNRAAKTNELWNNHAALWLKTSTHITLTRPQINLKRSLCQLKFKVPCHFQLQVLMDARNVSVSCTGLVSPVFVLLAGIGSQSSVQKKPAFYKHTSKLH